MKRALFAALLASLATAARAQPTQSPRWGSFELSAGTYRPDIDSEFPGRRRRVHGRVRHGPQLDVPGGGGAKRSSPGYGTLEVGLGTGLHEGERARAQDGRRRAPETRPPSR